MDARELESAMGFTAGELEETVAAYESGEWPEGRTVRLGHPLLTQEPQCTQLRSYFMPKYIYQAILTTDNEGGYNVEFPSLPGCFTCGATLQEAAEMAMDAASSYIAALLKDELVVPSSEWRATQSGETSLAVAFTTDQDYIIEDDVTSTGF